MARTIDRAPPSGPDSPGLEARVAKLEAAVEHIERDVADMKGVLSRLATVVDRMDGILQAMVPTLATKAETRQSKSGPGGGDRQAADHCNRRDGGSPSDCYRRPALLGALVCRFKGDARRAPLTLSRPT